MDDLLSRVQDLFRNENYRLTLHAERERENDALTMKEIEECILGVNLELIENYPEDIRGPSFLLLGFTNKNIPVHFVCAIHEDVLIFITMYKPDSKKWREFRERIQS